ncbi:MAG: bifunctional folylpolyglutamate synthase/dihydrofolate synthase [Flavobacteriaceae bacterium]
MHTYDEVTQWLYTQIPVYQQQGATAYKPGLTKMTAFVDYLGNPHTTFPMLHVAGTNGKGSTSHLLASALQEMGYNVGLYTSPHLLDFSERIRLNGQLVEQEFIIDFVQQHKAYILSEQLSFFEITVGMAFAYFTIQKVDYALIEVGLGGRLDATNVITPLLAVITNIGLDHTEFLGTTLAEIAAEKAGIIKENIPVVIGEAQAETRPVFHAIAKEKQAPLYFAEETIAPSLSTDLMGAYQFKNLRAAYLALTILMGEQPPKAAIAGFNKVVENTGLRGRWEILSEQPKVIADVTHNTEGFKYVVDQLNALHKTTLHLVLGFVEGKKLEAIFALLPKDGHYYFCAPAIPRAMSIEKVKRIAENHGLNAQFYSTSNAAYHAARENAQAEDILYVGGSTFVVAEILS